MADLRLADTSSEETESIVEVIESLKKMVDAQRRDFARRWYDNNFFDDGFHYRFIHRTTDRIVDLASKDVIFEPKRAIPKTSRQIRGIANLLLSFDWHPVIYPKRVRKENFLKGRFNFLPDLQDPETGEIVPNPDKLKYEKYKQLAKEEARLKGYWIEDEWKTQELFEEKLPLLVLLGMKNSVSYIQCWPDEEDGKIRTQVYDAFDVYLVGSYNDIQDSPFIGKVIPKTIREIKANPAFDEEQLEKISPDNKYASSEIKEAYLSSRYGGTIGSDASATILLNEFFIKETINENNLAKISKQENSKEIMEDREEGDTVIRHIFSTSGVWLKDEYTSLKKYPFVDFRMEPGPIYQVPQIERFIQANKSLDSIVSKIERYIGTSPLGVWTKRKGEDFKLTNVAGAQVVSYKTVPPQSTSVAGVPSFVFAMTQLLETLIEEQGVTTSALGKIPRGVKAHAAIESLKASEFSNLTIALNQMKKTVRKISEMFLEIGETYYTDIQEVNYMKDNEVDYFDVIGKKGLDLQKKVKNVLPDGTIVLDKSDKVRIEVETGPGYTMEGKRANTLEIVKLMSEMAANKLIPIEALKQVVSKLLETYQFGTTAEFVEAMEGWQGEQGMPQDQKMMMKEAVLEVIADLQKAQQGQAGGQQAPAQPTNVMGGGI